MDDFFVSATSPGERNVGYYDMERGAGNSIQIASITAGGHTAISVLQLSSTELADLDVLVVQNPSNEAYGAEFLDQLSTVQQAVNDGLVLVIHDRYVTDAQSILPGSTGFSFVRDTSFAWDVELLNDFHAISNGVAGDVTDTSLDGGNSSTHGYALQSSLPVDAEFILSTEISTNIVTFAYGFGMGTVVYSSIPLDYYLSGISYSSAAAGMNIYAANIVDYAANILSGRSSADEDTVYTIAASDLLANDTDLEDDPLTITSVDGTSANGASVSINGDGDVVYDPTGSATIQALSAGETLEDTFTYTVSDGELTDTATVTVTVSGANDAPDVVANDPVTFSEDDVVQTINLLAGASDPEDDDLSAINITATDENGDAVAFTDNGDGTISIDPDQFGLALDEGENRTVTVSFDVSDGTENTSNTATLVVTGAFDPNIPPVAQDDSSSNAIDTAIAPLTGDIQINTETIYDQERSSIAALSDGGFVVTWTSDYQDGSEDGVYGQLFDDSGAPVGDEFQVNTFTNGSQHSSSIACALRRRVCDHMDQP